jgi:hypothetical protein
MAKAKSRTEAITMDFEGHPYSGTYTVEKGTVCIDCRGRRNGPTQAGADEELTARMLFRELLQGLKATGALGRPEPD